MDRVLTTTALTEGVQELVPLRSHVCLPGEHVLTLESTAVVSLAGGLRPLFSKSKKNNSDCVSEEEDTVVVAELCGPVACDLIANNVRRYTLDAPAVNRYIYCQNDPVVAIIVKKTTSYYSCYTGAATLAILDALSFDGATKSSRPRLQEGDVVYAFVRPMSSGVAAAVGATRMNIAGDETELSCMAGEVSLVAKDWTSADAVFGPLNGGTVVRVPIPYARSLLASDGASYLLSLLGKRVPFEVCVGVNGFVWVCGQGSDVDATAAPRRTVVVASCIVEAQYDATPEEMEARVQSYFPSE